jgi:hypothetical protein
MSRINWSVVMTIGNCALGAYLGFRERNVGYFLYTLMWVITGERTRVDARRKS